MGSLKRARDPWRSINRGFEMRYSRKGSRRLDDVTTKNIILVGPRMDCNNGDSASDSVYKGYRQLMPSQETHPSLLPSAGCPKRL